MELGSLKENSANLKLNTMWMCSYHVSPLFSVPHSPKFIFKLQALNVTFK